MNGKLAVYTCIVGDYDALIPPRAREPSVDYFCFTDQAHECDRGWELRPLPSRLGNGKMGSRFVKMHPHLLFAEYAASIYVDGNIAITGELAELAEISLQNRSFALYDHPFRNCVYDEANVCALLGYDWYWRIQRQMRSYMADGLPRKNGLFEANILIRRHHDPSLVRLMESWWQAFSTGVRRDQLSLPFLLMRHGIDVFHLGTSDARFAQKHFSITLQHKRRTPLPIKARGQLNRIAMSLHQWPIR